MNQQTLQVLPLELLHKTLEARFGEFAGWRMPLWYSGAIPEHQAVRKTAGIFDISHMGRYGVDGHQSAELIASVCSRDPSRLAAGGSVYGLICNDAGGIIDDIIVYRLHGDSYVVICNASNNQRVGELLRAAATRFGSTVSDFAAGSVLLAIQGPDAIARVAPALAADLSGLARRACCDVTVGGESYFLARTGYTGEDGIEVICSTVAGRVLFDRLVLAGVTPCGLAARDSLRLEASLHLHGHDIDETTLPWEAGLGWAVELDHEFPGRDSLVATKAAFSRHLVCLVSDGQGVFRSHQDVYDGDDVVGTLASGGFSPMLNTSIAMAYLPRGLGHEGDTFTIDLRGRRVPCHVVKRPFYSSPDLASKKA